MHWIALKMLTGDRAKFFGIVLGLTFAALLIDQQGSIFCGLMCRTAGQVYDITGADLWVMDPNVRYIDDVKPMIENNLYRVRGVAGVEWAVPLYKGNARAKLNSTGADGTRHQVIEQVILLGLDDASLVGAPPPARMLAGELVDLRRPDAVVVDFTRLRKLYPGERWSDEPSPPSFSGRQAETASRAVAQITGSSHDSRHSLHQDYGAARTAFYSRFIGRELEMNDHRAIIVGVCEATRTFQSNAVVYTTYSRAKLFVPRERKVLSYVLAKTDPGVAPSKVATRIKDQTGLRARTSAQFIDDTIDYYLRYTGIPINFGITTLLGFLVGTAIAGQTFYNFTIENLKQFGALKAMGATNLRIVAMILLQAAVVGLLGYGLGVGLAALFGEHSKNTELAFYTPWQLLPITGGAVVLICFLSSILSVRRVVVLEPAVVFRG
jgi:putative ABC transport system permease protein